MYLPSGNKKETALASYQAAPIRPFTCVTLVNNKTTRSTQFTDTVSVIRLLATHCGEDHTEGWPLPEKEQHNSFLTLIH